MLHADLLHLTLDMAAPAFFCFLALAGLGAPLVAFICLAAARTRRTQHHEVYGRRLLRMAFGCTWPSLAVLIVGAVIDIRYNPWLGDWLLAAALWPAGLAFAAGIAYCVALAAPRLNRPLYRRSRDENRLVQALWLAVSGLVCLWLGLYLAQGLGRQLQAVLDAPTAAGMGVAPLVRPSIAALRPLFWVVAVAAVPLAAACAGAASVEYFLFLHDREPFGREAFDQTLRLAARVCFRSALAAAAFLPALWTHIDVLPPAAGPAKTFAMGSGITLLLACLLWIQLARSRRPSAQPILLHVPLFLVWIALTHLLAAGLVCLYAV